MGQQFGKNLCFFQHHFRQPLLVSKWPHRNHPLPAHLDGAAGYAHTYTQHGAYAYTYTQHGTYAYTYTQHGTYAYAYTQHGTYLTSRKTVLLD